LQHSFRAFAARRAPTRRRESVAVRDDVEGSERPAIGLARRWPPRASRCRWLDGLLDRASLRGLLREVLSQVQFRLGTQTA